MLKASVTRSPAVLHDVYNCCVGELGDLHQERFFKYE